MDKAFSSIDLVGQCLLDEQRTDAFKRAIYRAIKPKMQVIDSGTGSGILAIFAAQAGAARVFAIELDPYVASIARKNFSVNDQKNIELIEADARTTKIPSEGPASVVLMEMLTTGMIDEFQVAAIANFKKVGCISEKTVFIPRAQQSFLSIGCGNFEFKGVTMPMPLHVWDIHVKEPRFVSLAGREIYDNYTFSQDGRTTVDTIVQFHALKTGILNAILIESKSILDDKESLEETPALNGKVMMPIPEINVAAGDTIKVRIQYTYGMGFENLKTEIVQ
jgi:predicted RNA methylase